MLLGLHGTAESGKDTTFVLIRDWAARQGHRVRRDAFADRVKVSAVRALGYKGTDAECLAIGNQLKRGWEIVVREPDGTSHPLSGREYIQYYGDEAHRQTFSESFWLPFVLDAYDHDSHVVVTDVRYDNEAAAIRALDGVIWEVVGTDSTRMDHDSERGISPGLIDRTINNDSDLDHLRRCVDVAVEELAWLPTN